MQLKGNFFVFVLSFVLFIQFTVLSQSNQAEVKALSRGADVILTGKVTKQQSEWAQNKSRIITKTTIQVDEYLKGNGTNGVVVINHPGGEVDGVGELYSHMPEFQNEEEVLLFLKKDNKSNDYKVFAGEDGKISLLKDNSGVIMTASKISLSSLKAQIKSYTE
ncbi:MAG TPA: hypothetical protein VKD08_09305 [Ignavibacteriaceae bacterium]|jgi:hypothetical protein|nr:hypothetical protein [Ignavibacteriaceae bacterium]